MKEVRQMADFGTICSRLCSCEASRYVYFRWSRVQTAVTVPVGMWECCKSWVKFQASEIGEIQAPIAHKCRVLSRPDLHHLFLCFLKILHMKLTMFCGFGGTLVALSNHISLTLPPIDMRLILLDATKIEYCDIPIRHGAGNPWSKPFSWFWCTLENVCDCISSTLLPYTDMKLVTLDTAKIEVYKDTFKHSDIPITIG